MSQKKDIKLVKKLLKNDNKRGQYTPEELQYMSLWLFEKKLKRRMSKAKKKQQKGFGNLE